uniref:Uncharacterized protein n=1 Tax=Rhizophora mucronata TaxID=61149 RepID=A0A2P2PWF6_RHIMU
MQSKMDLLANMKNRTISLPFMVLMKQ